MKRIAPLLIGVVAAAVCVRLGLWQLSRHAERRELNATLNTSLLRSPVDIRDVPDRASLGLRRATARGVFDFDRQIVLVGRSRNGVPGVHIVTPLRLEGGDAVLIERGFVPSPDGRLVDLGAMGEPGSSLVEGILLPEPVVADTAPSGATWPLHLRRVDPQRLTARYPYRVHPNLLRRTSAPSAAPEMLFGLAAPERSNGPHLSYAIQWFSFATIAIVGTVILVAKSRPGAAAGKG